MDQRSRPFRPPNDGFRAKGAWNNHRRGGRKHHHGSRNGDPRWSPMAPWPPRGPPSNFKRFPAPPDKNQGFQNVAPIAGRGPSTSGVSGHAGSVTAVIDRFSDVESLPVPQSHIRKFQVNASQNQHVHPPPSQSNAPAPALLPRVPDHQESKTTPTSPKKTAPSNADQFTSSLPQISLNTSLPTFDLQAVHAVQQCLLSPQGRRDVDWVVADLQQLLQSLIPDNYPILYGSMATGLALETSDIDCFIDSASIPDGRHRIEILLKNFRILGRKQTFHGLFSIPKARVPLVKAVHSKTGIEIDISCTSQAALYNSRLIKRLVEVDVRIRPLIILISICYRLNGLNGTHRFVSYTLVLLIIFYLQNLECPMLPPLNKIVFHLQGERWPVGFRLNVLSHLQSPNQRNLAELFSGFFKFYSSFDFGQKVVSPYMGQALPVESFSTPDILPDELTTLKEFYNEEPLKINNFLNKFISVQDPMEHYINTTSYVQFKTHDHFKKVNSYMVEMMGSHPETSWLEKMMKMTEDVPVTELPKTCNKQNPDVFFNISYPKDELEEEEWLLKLKEHLQEVFKFLLFGVVEVSKEPEAKVRIAEGPVHDRTLMTFELHSSFNVYNKRFKALPFSVLSNPCTFKPAGEEISRISQQMKKPSASFRCEFSVKQPISPREIPVQIRDINENPANTYQHMSGMLRHNLSKLLESVKQSEKVGERSKEQNEELIFQKSRQSAGTRFSISYKKEENEDEEAWKTRLRVDLISLFEFLLMEHSDVTATCENINPFAGNDESIIFGFQLKTSCNLFTKRFNYSYLRALEDPSCIPKVASKNVKKSKAVNPKTSGTFHCELLLLRSGCLSPHQVFVALYNINQNQRNNFSHYSAMLLENFGGLLNSFKKLREAQNEACEK